MRAKTVLSVLFVATLIASGCIPDPPESHTDVYFFQSEENQAPDTDTALYLEPECMGEKTDDILQARSVFLDGRLYLADVDSSSGLVSGLKNDQTLVGTARMCGSIKKGTLMPLISQAATFVGPFTIERSGQADLVLELDGTCNTTPLTAADSWATQGSLTACSCKVLPNEAERIIGGRAVSNSVLGSLAEQPSSSFWVVRLVYGDS